MESATHTDHGNAAQVSKDHLARVTCDGGLGEVGNVLEGHPFDYFDPVAQQAQPCATDNGQLRCKARNTDRVGN